MSKCESCNVITDNLGKSYITNICSLCSYQIVKKGEIAVKREKIEEVIEMAKCIQSDKIMNIRATAISLKLCEMLEDLIK